MRISDWSSDVCSSDLLVEIEFGDLEGLMARQEGDARAFLALGRPDDLERGDRVTTLEAHEIFFVVPPDREVEKVAQRVDHRHADAVQPARDLISIVVARIVEFSAGVELSSEEHTSELQSLMRISY